MRRLFFVFLVVAGSVAMGACGGESETRQLTVVGTEMAFAAPDKIEGGDYEVTFRNDGAVPHELAFRTAAGKFVARRSIGAGQEVVMAVTLEPGTYELGCFEPGHYEAGMHRLLTVLGRA